MLVVILRVVLLALEGRQLTPVVMPYALELVKLLQIVWRHAQHVLQHAKGLPDQRRYHAVTVPQRVLEVTI